MNSVFTIILYTQTALSAGVALFSFISFRKRELYIKFIGLLFLIGFLCNITGIIFFIFKFGNTNIPGSVYDLCLITIVSLVYNIQTRFKYWKQFLFITSFFLIFATLNLLFFQKTETASFNKLLTSFIIISYAIFYFYRLMVEMPTSHIQKLPMFWFNSGFLFYHAGSVFLFAFTTYITKVLNADMLLYWIFHNCLSVIEHLLILFGLAYDLRKKAG